MTLALAPDPSASTVYLPLARVTDLRLEASQDTCRREAVTQ